MQKIRTPGPQCFSYWLLHNKLGGLKYFTIWAGQFSVLCGVYLGWIRQEGFFTPMSGIRAGMLETTVGWRVSCSVMSDSLWTRGLYPPGASVHGDSPGKNTGVGCHALLQGIFPTQGSNPGLLHYRQILYWLSPMCQTLNMGRPWRHGRFSSRLPQ